ncbi:hypothetical protein PQX77_006358 [Marasmius sp. AFHP31]|nr:hypothetical protein PQX77_006358 [Marasmius sp. AFHP31]
MDLASQIRRLEHVYRSKPKCRALDSRRGQGAEKSLDLLQLLIDHPDLSDHLRSKICSTMLHISKKTGFHPKCLVIENVEVVEKHPVDGGGYADMWKGRLGKSLVCLKILRIFKEPEVQQVLKECNPEAVLWKQLRHPNVLPFLGVFLDTSGRPCLVSPWMENGNLTQYIESADPAFSQRVLLAFDVASGLAYLHEKSIVHGDLKGLNVLITPDLRACISNFGLSIVAETSLRFSNTSSAFSGGTTQYQAPEVVRLNISKPTKESDVYSYGCVAYEVKRDIAVGPCIMNGARPERPTDIPNLQMSDELWTVMEECWKTEPPERPSAGDLRARLIEIESIELRDVPSITQNGSEISREVWEKVYRRHLSGADIDTFIATLEMTEALNEGSMLRRGSANAGLPLKPVAPLRFTKNRWNRAAVNSAPADSPEVVDRKVRGLLNKITLENFDSISDQIITWANKSEKEKDGRTLIQVIRLVFQKAIDEVTFSEVYARLCRKIMEQISPQVQDDDIKNAEGKPISGGQLFKKYLLNRCQEDFERGWAAKEATTTAAAAKSVEDKAKAADSEKKEGEDGEASLCSDEYYAALKAKRQGLGLIRFIGELFKLQMLTERIMHECVKKLVGNVENPEEVEIESLCELLTVVGQVLDTKKARAHMDVYFSRMKKLTKSPNVSSRMRFMLQDVIELREREWAARSAVVAPTTIKQIHEQAAKAEQATKEAYTSRNMPMFRTGLRRGQEIPDPATNREGRAGTGGRGRVRATPQVGDLSKFGQISNKSVPMTLGLSSVFNKKEAKRESPPWANSSANMFQMIQNDAATEASTSKGNRPPSRKASVGLTHGMPTNDVPAQRRKLVLLPRTKPLEDPNRQPESKTEEPEAEMSDADAKKKIEESLKEFFAVRNLEEAEVYFEKLPAQHHMKLVDKLISRAVESEEADAQLVSDLLRRASLKSLASSAALEEAFSSLAEFLDDIVYDAPKAPNLFALMLKGAGLNNGQRTRITSKSESNGQKVLELSSSSYLRH